MPAEHVVAQLALPACHALVVHLDLHVDVVVDARGAPQALGRAVDLDGVDLTAVGVATAAQPICSPSSWYLAECSGLVIMSAMLI